MRIAFLGSRGIPACYSGFETFVEQVGVRLAARGHEVTVYNRVPFNRFTGSRFKGVRIVRIPTVQTKGTDTIIHTFLSCIHALFARHDIAYFCGVGNAIMGQLPKLVRSRVIVNVDGADFERAKWSGFGRWWLHRSESWASKIAHAVVADNTTIRDRYLKLYGVNSHYIPYGSNVVTTDPGIEALKTFHLTSKDYFLYVSRLTPENAADLAIEAYLRSGARIPLVVVGDAPYQEGFISKLRSLASGNPRVILTGYQFGEVYQQLSFHARAFILPTAIDATRPVLLDQMGFGNCVIVRNTPGNVEVIGDSGIVFDHDRPLESLSERLLQMDNDPQAALSFGARAQRRVAEKYDWEVVTSDYEALFNEQLKRGS